MASKKEMENLFQEWDKMVETKRSEVDSDGEDFSTEDVEYVGGLDISYCSECDDDLVHARAALVVTEFPEEHPTSGTKKPKALYRHTSWVHVDVPYISGYLGFREAKWYIEELDLMRQECPEFYPQVLLVDGNGILHHDGFGSACHVGVDSGIPTIGVAKQLLSVDGLSKDAKHLELIEMRFIRRILKIPWTDKFYIPEELDEGDTFNLEGHTRGILGKALRSKKRSKKLNFISVGHKIKLDDAVDVVRRLCYHREPEPIRQADRLSRKKSTREEYRKHIAECTLAWRESSERLKNLMEYAKEIKHKKVFQ